MSRQTISRRVVLTLAAVLLVCGTVAAEGKGGYAAPWLQFPMGARAAGMGGAYLAVSDDGAAPLFNPAGVTSLRKSLFSSSYRSLGLDRTLGYASVLIPTQGESVIGGYWLYAGSGDVAARNADGDLLGFDVSQNSHSFSVLFAKRFEDFLSLGMAGSYMLSNFAEMSANTVKIDLGAMFHLSYLLFDRDRRELFPIQDIQVGLVVRNIAAQYRWNSEDYITSVGDGLAVVQSDDIPIEIGLGGSARFLKRKLVLATDVVKNLEQDIRFYAGGEYYLTREFALRTGLADTRFTAGTGYIFKFADLNLAIDYAFSTDRVEEGEEHIFSFDLLF